MRNPSARARQAGKKRFFAEFREANASGKGAPAHAPPRRKPPNPARNLERLRGRALPGRGFIGSGIPGSASNPPVAPPPAPPRGGSRLDGTCPGSRAATHARPPGYPRSSRNSAKNQKKTPAYNRGEGISRGQTVPGWGGREGFPPREEERGVPVSRHSVDWILPRAKSSVGSPSSHKLCTKPARPTTGPPAVIGCGIIVARGSCLIL